MIPLDSIVRPAHIVGVPVEETLGMFGPAFTAMVGAMGATVRLRWRRQRDAHHQPLDAHRPLDAREPLDANRQRRDAQQPRDATRRGRR